MNKNFYEKKKHPEIHIFSINIYWIHFFLWKSFVDMKYSIILKIMKIILNFSYFNIER